MNKDEQKKVPVYINFEKNKYSNSVLQNLGSLVYPLNVKNICEMVSLNYQGIE